MTLATLMPSFVAEMDKRVDASNEMIGAFAVGTTLAGTGLGVAPVAVQALKEVALGPSVGSVVFEGATGAVKALESGTGQLLTTQGLGKVYFNQFGMDGPCSRRGLENPVSGLGPPLPVDL